MTNTDIFLNNMIYLITFGKAIKPDTKTYIIILTLSGPYFQCLPLILLRMSKRFEDMQCGGGVAAILTEDVLVATCV
jgi:hypothetical protein